MEHFYGRHPLYPGYLSGTKDGQPAAPLLGRISAFDLGAADITISVAELLAGV